MSAGDLVPGTPVAFHQGKPATVTVTTGTLTDDEIERIARRVAELIQGRNYQGTVIPRSVVDAPIP